MDKLLCLDQYVLGLDYSAQSAKTKKVNEFLWKKKIDRQWFTKKQWETMGSKQWFIDWTLHLRNTFLQMDMDYIVGVIQFFNIYSC